MKYFWLEKEITYDGSQLKPLFSYMNAGPSGDSIVAWQGPCNVPLHNMVDGEDRRELAKISSDKMLHFIVEKFPANLSFAVAAQRLLAGQALERLRELCTDKSIAFALTRAGDDIWLSKKKLSISIATVSQISSLIHFAINISNEGTPVETLSLGDLKIEPISFAKILMQSFSREMDELDFATQKVFPV
ncbi:MAG: DUF366 family protein [Pseudomonadota bacterium]|nr:DUF366 family protein [Pseudomonadota bacterium]